MHWTCAKCEGWEGSCWEVIFKVGLQNTTGSSSGCGVYLKSSTKEIIPTPYSLRLSLRIQNSLQLFITIKKKKLWDTCSIVFVVVSHFVLFTFLLCSRTCIQETAGLSKDPRAILWWDFPWRSIQLPLRWNTYQKLFHQQEISPVLLGIFQYM